VAGGGIVGDDTDGHIDDLARFVSSSLIVCAVEDDRRMRITNCCKTISAFATHTDAQDRPFELVTLPMPGIVGGASTRRAISIVCLPATQFLYREWR